MFCIGDYIVYGDSDVCRVTDIGIPQIQRKNSSDRQFYFLETQFYKGIIYAPVDTQVPMRPVVSREEALMLIERMPSLASCVCQLSDKKKLSEHYEMMMKPHTAEALARTAKSIYEKYHLPDGKKRIPNSTEAACYKKVNELLLQELSIALNESIEEVQRRIETRCALTGSIARM